MNTVINLLFFTMGVLSTIIVYKLRKIIFRLQHPAAIPFQLTEEQCKRMEALLREFQADNEAKENMQ